MTPTSEEQPLFTPAWHSEAKTPIVDKKYYDPVTGELRVMGKDDTASPGPPDVDIVIKSLHAVTAGCVVRASRPSRMETVLHHIVRIIHDRKLKVDSLMATPYAIRVILAHDLTKEEFSEIAEKMVVGIGQVER